MAAVATTERTKPSSRDSHGSTSSRTTTVAASAAGARAGRPASSPTSPTVPVTAARSTLGCGPTRSSNPAPAASTAPARAARGSRHEAATPATSAPMIAKCEPETAIRCVSPAARIASARSSGTRELSPSAMPTRSPPASAGSRAAMRWVSARTRSARRSGQLGAPTTCGGDDVDSVATARAEESWGVPSRPVTRTVPPRATTPGDTTRTDADAADRRPRLSTHRAARVNRCFGSPWLQRASTGTGPSTTTPVRLTVAPCERAVPSTPSLRADR